MARRRSPETKHSRQKVQIPPLRDYRPCSGQSIIALKCWTCVDASMASVRTLA